MKRKASAEWQGDLKGGKGTISSDSGVLSNARYSFTTRFENEKGTNPEELIAAAHAGCFSMALSAELGKANLTPGSIRTTATVSLDKLDTGWTVIESHLEVSAKVPGASQDSFLAAARAAETGCPISKLLKAKITMNARLES
ncbi:MAG TPA: OsmC family protein [Thermoanaerobaculia bacterium]|nr:OsmC family protein [Thermoanaerobaculia bacterium]